MATRFYLPSSGSAPVTPAYDAAWTNTSFAARLPCYTSKQSTTMATVADNINIKTLQHHLYRQWISEPISAQTISIQTIKLQIRAAESDAKANLFVDISIRVVSNDGNTVRGTIRTRQSDNTEFALNTLTNRAYTTTSSSAVTASANDRIVIEIGQGGDPIGGGSHNDGTLRIGDAAASDLPENDTSTDDYNPWVEFANTITFPSPGDDLTAQDITSGTPTLETPVLARIVNLDPTDITSGTPTLQTPTIKRITHLSATDITSGTPTLEAPTITRIVNLDATDIASGTPTVEQPTITRIVNLDATDISAGTPTLEAPTITRIVNLDATEISAGTPTLEQPTIGSGGTEDHLTARDLLALAPLFDAPLLFAYTTTPPARTTTPILATLSTAPTAAQRTNSPDLATLTSIPPAAQRTSVPY